MEQLDYYRYLDDVAEWVDLRRFDICLKVSNDFKISYGSFRNLLKVVFGHTVRISSGQKRIDERLQVRRGIGR